MQMQNKWGKMKEIKKNIKLSDFLWLPLTTFKLNVCNLFITEKIVKNWPDVLLFRLGLKKKFIMELRNGGKIKIENLSNYFNFWNNF